MKYNSVLILYKTGMRILSDFALVLCNIGDTGRVLSCNSRADVSLCYCSGAIILVVSESWSSRFHIGACCSLAIKSFHESVVISKSSELGHDWFEWGLVDWPATGHCMSQYWLVVRLAFTEPLWGSAKGFPPSRWQAIVWSHDDWFHWIEWVITRSSKGLFTYLMSSHCLSQWWLTVNCGSGSNMLFFSRILLAS